jgi:hypothetical protein
VRLCLPSRAEEVKEKPVPTTVSDFRARPLTERRAASVYAHVDGQDGPSQRDVARACLHCLVTLLSQSNASQISAITQASFDSLDKRGGWNRPAECSWLARRIVDWAEYQYRYAVPSLLVERLVELQDTPAAAPAQRALIAMITAVFTSPTPLNNLSTSDIISSLVTLVLRRASISPTDELLPPLVDCIASLGTHVYYRDQIQVLFRSVASAATSLICHRT